jgi:hypothetical protein
LIAQRCTPSKEEFQNWPQLQQKNFLSALQEIPISKNEDLAIFEKKGWLISNTSGKLSTPCPIFIDIIFHDMFFATRPNEDHYGLDLSKFMMEFLTQLNADLILNSKCKPTHNPRNRKKEICLEAFWSYEFYRIGFKLLRRDTTIHSEVQEINAKEMKGKVDYIVKNGDRLWLSNF